MVQNNQGIPLSARFDVTGPAVLIESLTVDDPTVVAEARCWSQGHRGPAVGHDELETADLSNFVVQALVVGAQAIGTAGGIQQTFDLKDLVAEVGDRTAQSATHAAESTEAAIGKAAAAMELASSQAKRAIAEAGTLARREFSINVDDARSSLSTEITRLVGGENPELLSRLEPLLDRFGRDLDERSARQTGELVAKVARQFDPAEPASVLAQQNRMLTDQHRMLSEALTREQSELAKKVDELATAVKVAHAARTAAVATAQRTPLKGDSYADAVHGVLGAIATGLGDDYADTSGVTGLVSRSKKGDGLLSVEGGDVRVAIEMTDSARGSGWGPYLAEAERNRGASASIGLVRSADQLRGSTVVALGARRILLAFDPDTDSSDLLRTVVQLVRLAAVAAAQRHATGEIHTAEEKINEALATLSAIDTIETTAGQIVKSASKISGESGALRTEITRLLKQAATALSGAQQGESDSAAA